MKENVIDTLIDIGAIKFGEFTLKSGIISPIYIDLRLSVSYPKLLSDIAEILDDLAKGLKFQRVAGIPYTALPIATAFSLRSGIPMIYARKEAKEYGTKKQIEGVFNPGERVLVIDDLITTGDSKFETLDIFKAEELEIQDVAVLIDREQGGTDKLAQQGVKLHSLITVTEILERTKQRGVIDLALFAKVRKFLDENG